jgi:hypothetical protein
MRKATVERKTKETEVAVEIAIDGSGKSNISTSVPFLDHMLELFARHGLFDLSTSGQREILRLITTTRSRTSGSPWGNVLKRRLATARESGATEKQPCPWTNR